MVKPSLSDEPTDSGGGEGMPLTFNLVANRLDQLNAREKQVIFPVPGSIRGLAAVMLKVST